MLMRFNHWPRWCLAVGVIVVTAAGCPEKEQPPPATTDDTKAEVSEPQEADDAVNAKVVAKLAQADLVDGTEDKIVSKCPSCALAMDGKPEHALEVSGYTLHFCSADCKEGFAKDTTQSILAMELPGE